MKSEKTAETENTSCHHPKDASTSGTHLHANDCGELPIRPHIQGPARAVGIRFQPAEAMLPAQIVEPAQPVPLRLPTAQPPLQLRALLTRLGPPLVLAAEHIALKVIDDGVEHVAHADTRSVHDHELPREVDVRAGDGANVHVRDEGEGRGLCEVRREERNGDIVRAAVEEGAGADVPVQGGGAGGGAFEVAVEVALPRKGEGVARAREGPVCRWRREGRVLEPTDPVLRVESAARAAQALEDLLGIDVLQVDCAIGRGAWS